MLRKDIKCVLDLSKTKKHTYLILDRKFQENNK